MLEGMWLQTKQDVIHLKYVTGVSARQEMPIPDSKYILEAVLVNYFGPVTIDLFETLEDAVAAKEWFYDCMSSMYLDMGDWNAGRTDASKREDLLKCSLQAVIDRAADAVGKRD